ncbi:MAG TPA: G8 domain-containing protein [Smithellaceae bacterium]|nr:G8 domain-containing protein [Smithellaceae bacterium]
MATIVSTASGTWGSGTTWSGGIVPANGDAVTIGASHTVVFDVDQSSFISGLSTVTVTGTLTFSTAASSYIYMKMASAHIAGAGKLYVGVSGTPIPRTSRVTIRLPSTDYGITTTTQTYYGWVPTTMQTSLAAGSVSGSTTLTISGDLDLQTGDMIAVGSGGTSYGYLAETAKGLYTVGTYVSGNTITLTSGLQTIRYSGDLCLRASTPILVTRPASTAYYALRSASSKFEGVTVENTYGCNGSYSTFNKCVSKAQTSTYGYGNLCLGGAYATLTDCNAVGHLRYGVAWNAHYGTVTRCCGVSGRDGIVYSSYGLKAIDCKAQNLTYPCNYLYGSSVDGFEAKNCSYGILAYSIGSRMKNSTAKGGYAGNLAAQCYDCYIENCTSVSPVTYGESYACYDDMVFDNCTVTTYGTGMASAYGSTNLQRLGYMQKFINVNGDPTKWVFYSNAGYWLPETTVVPPNRTSCAKGYIAFATTAYVAFPLVWYWKVNFPAGVPMTFSTWVRKTFTGGTVVFEIVDPTDDPLLYSDATALNDDNITDVANTWELLTVTYTSTITKELVVRLRVQNSSTGGYVYFDNAMVYERVSNNYLKNPHSTYKIAGGK